MGEIRVLQGAALIFSVAVLWFFWHSRMEIWAFLELSAALYRDLFMFVCHPVA